MRNQSRNEIYIPILICCNYYSDHRLKRSKYAIKSSGIAYCCMCFTFYINNKHGAVAPKRLILTIKYINPDNWCLTKLSKLNTVVLKKIKK